MDLSHLTRLGRLIIWRIVTFDRVWTACLDTALHSSIERGMASIHVLSSYFAAHSSHSCLFCWCGCVWYRGIGCKTCLEMLEVWTCKTLDRTSKLRTIVKRLKHAVTDECALVAEFVNAEMIRIRAVIIGVLSDSKPGSARRYAARATVYLLRRLLVLWLRPRLV